MSEVHSANSKSGSKEELIKRFFLSEYHFIFINTEVFDSMSLNHAS